MRAVARLCRVGRMRRVDRCCRTPRCIVVQLYDRIFPKLAEHEEIIVRNWEDRHVQQLVEVMAAGAIPVFVSGSRRATSPYVRPFGEVIDWPAISLHFAWEAVPAIPEALRRLSPAQVAAMQRGVRRAWRRHLHPRVASTTFYSLLEARAQSRV